MYVQLFLIGNAVKCKVTNPNSLCTLTITHIFSNYKLIYACRSMLYKLSKKLYAYQGSWQRLYCIVTSRTNLCCRNAFCRVKPSYEPITIWYTKEICTHDHTRAYMPQKNTQFKTRLCLSFHLKSKWQCNYHYNNSMTMAILEIIFWWSN